MRLNCLYASRAIGGNSKKLTLVELLIYAKRDSMYRVAITKQFSDILHDENSRNRLLLPFLFTSMIFHKRKTLLLTQNST